MNLNVAPLQTLQLVLLAFFTIATTLLALVTVTNTIRLRNVQQSWASGKMMGYPLFASLFLGFILIVSAVVWAQQATQHFAAMVCYLCIGLNWFVASHYMMKRYITDHGIVKNINDPSQTIAWNEILDYVERKQDNGILYTFFYSNEDANTGLRKSYKLELPVPIHEMDEFQRILTRKLSRRFATGKIYVPGIEQIKKDSE